MKKDYVSIDWMKLLCACFVVAIHCPEIKEANQLFYSVFVGVICQFAVPFFFICSGFFLGNKITDWEKTKKYICRILSMYVIYSILHTPLIIQQYENVSGSAIKKIVLFLRDFLLVGSYLQFWYFAALILAVVILYVLINRMQIKNKSLFALAVTMYFAGAVIDCIHKYPANNTWINQGVSAYLHIFGSTRNGIFIGFPFIVIGYCASQRRNRFPVKRMLLFLLVNLGLKIGIRCSGLNEAYFCSIVQAVLLLSGSVVMFLIVEGSSDLCGKGIIEGLTARNLSTLMFGFHMLVKKIMLFGLQGWGGIIDAAYVYPMVLVATLLTSYAVLLLSKKFVVLKSVY